MQKIVSLLGITILLGLALTFDTVWCDRNGCQQHHGSLDTMRVWFMWPLHVSYIPPNLAITLIGLAYLEVVWL